MSEDRRGSKYLLITSLGALGVVFGDIGTSPLYAFGSPSTAEGLAVDQDSVLGILSLMFWALILVVTIKYLVFVMRADNHGEGGIIALTALAADGVDKSRSRRRGALMRYGWGWSAITAGTLTTVFLVIDIAFFTANIIKVPDGGWFPLAVGLIILTLMVLWKSGRERLTPKLHSKDLPIEGFIGSIARRPQLRVPGTAVYMYSDLGTPRRRCSPTCATTRSCTRPS